MHLLAGRPKATGLLVLTEAHGSRLPDAAHILKLLYREPKSRKLDIVVLNIVFELEVLGHQSLAQFDEDLVGMSAFAGRFYNRLAQAQAVPKVVPPGHVQELPTLEIGLVREDQVGKPRGLRHHDLIGYQQLKLVFPVLVRLTDSLLPVLLAHLRQSRIGFGHNQDLEPAVFDRFRLVPRWLHDERVLLKDVSVRARAMPSQFVEIGASRYRLHRGKRRQVRQRLPSRVVDVARHRQEDRPGVTEVEGLSQHNPLETVHAHRWCSGALFGQLLNHVGRHIADLTHCLRRLVCDVFPELVEVTLPDPVFHKRLVIEILSHEMVNHPQEEGGVPARFDRDPLIGFGSVRRKERIDHDQLGTAFLGIQNILGNDCVVHTTESVTPHQDHDAVLGHGEIRRRYVMVGNASHRFEKGDDLGGIAMRKRRVDEAPIGVQETPLGVRDAVGKETGG